MTVTASAGRPESPTGLSGAVRLLLAGDLITALGVGFTQPYLVVLLHTVRGVPLALAAGVVSLAALASLVGNVLAGPWIDRHGPRVVMVAGMLTAAGGLLAVALAPAVAGASFGIAATGLGWSLSMPALSTRLATLVPPDRHVRAYTWQYALFNVGMGSGAALGGLVLTLAPPGTARGAVMLPGHWLAAAATCVVTAVVATMVRTARPAPVGHPPGGYRRALSDRLLRRTLGAAILLATGGYGVYNAAPAVLALAAGDPSALAWLNVANCATVVCGLPLTLRLSAVLSPRAALLGTAALWAGAWVACLPAAYGTGPSVRAVLVVAAAAIGAGELLLAGALPTIVNALAPDALRGRYNALLSLALTVGMATGPLLTAAAATADAVAYLFLGAIAMAAIAALLLPPRAATAHVPDRPLVPEEVGG